MKLSLCLAVYNEEKNIHYPLDSAIDLVDEVVVVDGGSTDKTVEIAASYGRKVRIIKSDNPAMFHKNKQKAIEAARGEWILQLDADEELSKELKEEIKLVINPKSEIRNPKQIQNPNDQNSKQKSLENFNLENSDLFRNSDLEFRNYIAYWIPRKNFFLTRFLTKGGQYPDYTIRLYRNGYARFPCRDVHENVEIINPKSEIPAYVKASAGRQKSKQIQNSNHQNSKCLENSNFKNSNLFSASNFDIRISVGYLKNPILHYADPDFSRYLRRWDRYTSLEAEKLSNIPYRISNIKMFFMFWQYFFWKPLTTFFSIYIRHKGFLDGFPGFVFALFSSIRFWVIYIKFWHKKSFQNKK